MDNVPVIKMKLEEIVPEKLAKATDDEVKMAWLRLHQWLSEAKKVGKATEDIINAAAFLIPELKKRKVKINPKSPLVGLVSKLKPGGEEAGGEKIKKHLTSKRIPVPLKKTLDHMPDEILVVPNFVSVVGSAVVKSDPGDVDILIRSDRYGKHYLIQADNVFLPLRKALDPRKVGKSIHYITNPQGSHASSVPVYNLVLKRTQPEVNIIKSGVRKGWITLENGRHILLGEDSKSSGAGARSEPADGKGITKSNMESRRIAGEKLQELGINNVTLNRIEGGRAFLVDSSGNEVLQMSASALPDGSSIGSEFVTEGGLQIVSKDATKVRKGWVTLDDDRHILIGDDSGGSVGGAGARSYEGLNEKERQALEDRFGIDETIIPIGNGRLAVGPGAAQIEAIMEEGWAMAVKPDGEGIELPSSAVPAGADTGSVLDLSADGKLSISTDPLPDWARTADQIYEDLDESTFDPDIAIMVAAKTGGLKIGSQVGQVEVINLDGSALVMTPDGTELEVPTVALPAGSTEGSILDVNEDGEVSLNNNPLPSWARTPDEIFEYFNQFSGDPDEPMIQAFREGRDPYDLWENLDDSFFGMDGQEFVVGITLDGRTELLDKDGKLVGNVPTDYLPDGIRPDEIVGIPEIEKSLTPRRGPVRKCNWVTMDDGRHLCLGGGAPEGLPVGAGTRTYEGMNEKAREAAQAGEYGPDYLKGLAAEAQEAPDDWKRSLNALSKFAQEHDGAELLGVVDGQAILLAQDGAAFKINADNLSDLSRIGDIFSVNNGILTIDPGDGAFVNPPDYASEEGARKEADLDIREDNEDRRLHLESLAEEAKRAPEDWKASKNAEGQFARDHGPARLEGVIDSRAVFVSADGAVMSFDVENMSDLDQVGQVIQWNDAGYLEVTEMGDGPLVNPQQIPLTEDVLVTPGTQITVDRVDNGEAMLIDSDGKNIGTVPADALPAGAREGDVLDITWEQPKINVTATDAARARSAALIDKLKNKQGDKNSKQLAKKSDDTTTLKYGDVKIIYHGKPKAKNSKARGKAGLVKKGYPSPGYGTPGKSFDPDKYGDIKDEVDEETGAGDGKGKHKKKVDKSCENDPDDYGVRDKAKQKKDGEVKKADDELLSGNFQPEKPAEAGTTEYFDSSQAWPWCKEKIGKGAKLVGEVKHDGYRAIVVKNGGDVKVIFEDSGKDRASALPAIIKAIKESKHQSLVLDGELLAVSGGKITPRTQLPAMMAGIVGFTPLLYAFDLLYLDGRDLTKEPLSTRKEFLGTALEGVPTGEIKESESMPFSTRKELEIVGKWASSQAGSEGLMIKDETQPYHHGASGDWAKLKTVVELKCMITDVSKTENGYTYTCGLGNSTGISNTMEYGGTTYANMGKTFVTANQMAKPGQVINVRIEELLLLNDASGIRIAWGKPTVVSVDSAKSPDTVTEAINQARKARVLKEEVKHVDVPAHGRKGSLVAFVAASPGELEAARGEPFVGKVGTAFRKHYLEPLGLEKDQIFMTYLVPTILKSADSRVRGPNKEEIGLWAPRLTGQLNAVQPKVIVALGQVAKEALGDAAQFALPHPAAVARSGDIKEVARKIEKIKACFRG